MAVDQPAADIILYKDTVHKLALDVVLDTPFSVMKLGMPKAASSVTY